MLWRSTSMSCRVHAAVASTLFVTRSLFPLGTDEVVLTVQLDSQDFLLSDETRPLRFRASVDPLPRPASNPAAAQGPSTIKATVHKEGNFIQQMELTFDVGADRRRECGSRLRGVRRQRSTWCIRATLASRFLHWSAAMTAWCGERSRRALVCRCCPAYLASAVDAARHELLNVVMHQDEMGDYDFQYRIDIPHPPAMFALRTMARAGARLFQTDLFRTCRRCGLAGDRDFLRKERATGQGGSSCRSSPRARLCLGVYSTSAMRPQARA